MDFCFDDEAQAVFIEWFEDLHRSCTPSEEEPIIRQHLAKFDKPFPALALVFHLVEGAARGARGPVNIGKRRGARRPGANSSRPMPGAATDS
ncbi:MAG: DUF3987 domain-containing protein [Xanthomonadaceae bacterium]|nr:DUF3987 domain-containing protein [Xanthomonadaceae bacterium]